MFTQIKKLLAAPTFEGDEEKTRNAALCNVILWATLGLVLAAAPFLVAINRDWISRVMTTMMLLGFVLPVIGLIGVLRRGKVRLAIMTFLVLGLIIVTAGLFISGGIRGTTVPGYLLVIFVAGLLLGGRAAVVFGVLSMLAALGVFCADRYLGWVWKPQPLIGFDDLAMMLALSGIAAVLVGLALRSLNSALGQARGDERTLAGTNRELQASRDELRTRTRSLEHHTAQLQAVAEVTRDITLARGLSEVLNQAVNLIQNQFGVYHAGIYLTEEPIEPSEDTSSVEDAGPIEGHADLDAGRVEGESVDSGDAGADDVTSEIADVGGIDAEDVAQITGIASDTAEGEAEKSASAKPVYAVLRAATGEAGRQMLEQALRVPIDPANLIGRAIDSGHPRIALDVGPDAAHFENPLLPWTRSQIALPLRAGRRIIGALDIQRTEEAAFDEQDAVVLQIMADQLAVTIENDRLFEETRQTVHELETASRRYTEESWRAVTRRTGQARGYRYQGLTVEPTSEQSPEARRAWLQGHPVITTSLGGNGQDTVSTLAVPIKLREQTVGVLNLSFEGEPPSAGAVSLIEEIADRLALALENARLLDETRQRAEQDRLVAGVATQVRASIDLQNILQVTIRELGKAFGSDRTFIRLGVESQPAEE